MEIGNQPVYGDPQEMPLAENSDVEELLADVGDVQVILEEE